MTPQQVIVNHTRTFFSERGYQGIVALIDWLNLPENVRKMMDIGVSYEDGGVSGKIVVGNQNGNVLGAPEGSNRWPRFTPMQEIVDLARALGALERGESIAIKGSRLASPEQILANMKRFNLLCAEKVVTKGASSGSLSTTP